MRLNKLTATSVRNAKPGRHGDGGGLYLLVTPTGKSWIFRWRDRVTGKLRDHGLGAAWDVDLAEARERAAACRKMLRDGTDPIESKRKAITDAKLERARRLTFGECCTRYIAAHRAGWRNAKHAAQWTATLETYATTLQPLPVAEIDTALVMKCLEPHWATKTETMTRVRQRIEKVLDWATVREFRQGDNPARWRGHLSELLPKPTKLKRVQHRVALPYADMGSFMATLRPHRGIAAKALELQILTASRPGEAAGARWDEIDLDAALWTIPGERMKAGVEHRVPLSAPAVALLKALPKRGGLVFGITTSAMLKQARSIRAGIDVHGFRSTFRDWAAECTAYRQDVAEEALAHRLKDKAEAAYKRSDMLALRTRLMNDWARYCDTPAPVGNVTPIRHKAG